MKIAQIVCTYPPYRGGIGNVAKQFTVFMRSRGHMVTVFTPDNGQGVDQDELKLLKSPIKYGNAAFLPQLFYCLRDFNLVILHYPFFGSAEIMYLNKLIGSQSYKLLVFYHMDTSGFGWFKRILSLPDRATKKGLFDRADLVLASSFDYLEHSAIKEYFLTHREKFRELPFSVDTDFFTFSHKNSDKLNITFVGGLDKAHYFKGVDVLLRSAARMINREFVVNIVGSGCLVADYEKLAGELGIMDKVRFHQSVDNEGLVAKYHEADILVLPSVNGHEAFGVVLLEAMSTGTPVVASSLPGVRTVFTDGKEGFYVRAGDVDDLCRKLDILAGNKETRDLMGVNGRKLALEKYSKNSVALRLDKIINEK